MIPNATGNQRRVRLSGLCGFSARRRSPRATEGSAAARQQQRQSPLPNPVSIFLSPRARVGSGAERRGRRGARPSAARRRQAPARRCCETRSGVRWARHASGSRERAEARRAASVRSCGGFADSGEQLPPSAARNRGARPSTDAQNGEHGLGGILSVPCPHPLEHRFSIKLTPTQVILWKFSEISVCHSSTWFISWFLSSSVRNNRYEFWCPSVIIEIGIAVHTSRSLLVMSVVTKLPNGYGILADRIYWISMFTEWAWLLNSLTDGIPFNIMSMVTELPNGWIC
jgi:hypothetical protein